MRIKGNLVIAIDPGMSGTGMVLLFPDGTQIYHKWPDCDDNKKTETCILYNHDGGFHFGNEARIKLEDLEPEDQNLAEFYFNFKMTLFPRSDYGQPLPFTMEPLATALNGMQRPTAHLISDILAHCRQSAMDRLRMHPVEYPEEQVHWIVSVPAIWSQAAKDVMLQAARRAEFAMDRLSLVLEPEAAAFHCRFENQDAEKAIVPGTKYCVLDCGGGTVDIAVHEAMENGQVHSVCRPTGGAYGATSVLQCFDALLAEIFGQDTMEQSRQQSPDYPVLRCELSKVIEFGPDRKVKLNLAFLEYEDSPFDTNDSVQRAVTAYNEAHTTRLLIERRRLLFIPAEVVRECFRPTLDAIAALLWDPPNDTTILAKHPDIAFIFLVGGFAMSPLLYPHLQEALREPLERPLPEPEPPAGTGREPLEPRRLRIVKSLQPHTAVSQGAAFLGQNPRLISSRVVQYTLGVQASVPWGERDFEPNTPKIFIGGMPHVEGVFSPLVQIDTHIPVDKYYEKPYLFRHSATISLYAIERPVGPREAVFVSDCQMVFQEIVRNGGLDTERLIVRMYFGQERICVKSLVRNEEHELGGLADFAPFGA